MFCNNPFLVKLQFGLSIKMETRKSGRVLQKDFVGNFMI